MSAAQGQGSGYLLCTLDRFERDETGERLAVLVFDDGQQLIVAEKALPENTARGTVLRVSLAKDASETETRRESIQNLQDELFGE